MGVGGSRKSRKTRHAIRRKYYVLGVLVSNWVEGRYITLRGGGLLVLRGLSGKVLKGGSVGMLSDTRFIQCSETHLCMQRCMHECQETKGQTYPHGYVSIDKEMYTNGRGRRETGQIKAQRQAGGQADSRRRESAKD